MELKAEKQTLKALLAVDEQQFRIPPYQRPYSWTREQVDDLWNDLSENVQAGHFIGSVVLAAEDDARPLVIDGQQRLTTLMLILGAVRDACHARGMTNDVQQIEKRFIADDLANGDAQFKFRTGNANWAVFRDFTLRSVGDPLRKTGSDVGVLDKDLRARNRALLSNRDRIIALLASHLDRLPELGQEKWLRDFWKGLLGKVELVVIAVRDLGDAFLLFETLNDRGLQLSAADLLKSHMLGEIAKRSAEEDVDQAASSWDEMLDDLGAGVDVTRFLRHYLLGYVPKVKKDSVFDQFKELVRDRGAESVLADLRTAAGAYGEFEAPSKAGHEPTSAVLKDLATLRAVTCYIALLPARRYLAEKDFVEFARLAEVLTYRYSSVVGRGTNEIEPVYHRAAKILHDSQGTHLAEARETLIAAMPDAEQFRVAFQRLEMGRQYLVRYTLQRIEQALHPALEKMVDVSTLVHIEHVMPQTLNKEWSANLGSFADQHQEYVNRWGNLTLLFAGLNIPASNKVFEQKTRYYGDSQVRITQELCQYGTWGPEQIDARQRWLAEVAESIWRVDPVPHDQLPALRYEHKTSLDDFRERVGALWPAIEPYATDTTAQEIRSLATRLPAHLAGHAEHSSLAGKIADGLTELLQGWEGYSHSDRRFVRAVAEYFLEPEDSVPDELPGGLEDDRTALVAAFAALDRQVPSYLQS
ncbi:Protein of unknown function [Actinopolymorpha cephalotaxi]|uniref:DUF262 domain-containing protein n=3 Tax=Actinopolymorpha cephalotaxi TaxID=504797 RepID=A0A1I3A2H1_9ACTN|nr:DUF262 domain-containing protein [Actinopolymorpha cephalotaxi]NYH85381.1 hypothetical protein [Actinopolymorpha cephalotaxi]SFH44307.1 Protein of unknown function [Actinopolymorpha cephalotaxi]